MIDRLLIAAAILIAIAVFGVIIRASVQARAARLASTAGIAFAGAAATHLMLFSSAGCSACVTQRRVVETLRDFWEQPVSITYHDAVEEGELARRFGIMMVPALVVAAPDGRVVDVKQGLVDEDRLRSLIATAA